VRQIGHESLSTHSLAAVTQAFSAGARRCRRSRSRRATNCCQARGPDLGIRAGRIDAPSRSRSL